MNKRDKRLEAKEYLAEFDDNNNKNLSFEEFEDLYD